LVSSTAVTLTFAKRSREEDVSIGNSLVAGVLLAWSIMFVRVVVEVLIVNAPLVWQLLVPFCGMTAMSVVVALVYLRRGAAEKARSAVPLKNPFNLTSAVKFALFFAVIQVIVKLAQTYSTGGGLLAVAALAGLSDVDAITLSMAGYAKEGGDSKTAVLAIVIASLANTGVKCGIAVVLGSAVLRKQIILGTIAILLSGLLLAMW
jgi:uncharacterized membrane protein (DUF4010 family)